MSKEENKWKRKAVKQGEPVLITKVKGGIVFGESSAGEIGVSLIEFNELLEEFEQLKKTNKKIFKVLSHYKTQIRESYELKDKIEIKSWNEALQEVGRIIIEEMVDSKILERVEALRKK